MDKYKLSISDVIQLIVFMIILVTALSIMQWIDDNDKKIYQAISCNKTCYLDDLGCHRMKQSAIEKGICKSEKDDVE